jgi:hypothetical protein
MLDKKNCATNTHGIVEMEQADSETFNLSREIYGEDGRIT